MPSPSTIRVKMLYDSKSQVKCHYLTEIISIFNYAFVCDKIINYESLSS